VGDGNCEGNGAGDGDCGRVGCGDGRGRGCGSFWGSCGGILVGWGGD
jgi:hypothetical protein